MTGGKNKNTAARRERKRPLYFQKISCGDHGTQTRQCYRSEKGEKNLPKDLRKGKKHTISIYVDSKTAEDGCFCRERNMERKHPDKFCGKAVSDQRRNVIVKRINAKHNNGDRVICVTERGKHRFYYQPVGTSRRFWLFDTRRFSGSVFAFFRKNGRNMGDNGFSLTVKELYRSSKSRNCKISKIMERIPGQVEYVIRENISDEYEYRSEEAS